MYLDSFIWGSTEEIIVVDTQAPDRTLVANKGAFTLEDLLRIIRCEEKTFQINIVYSYTSEC